MRSASRRHDERSGQTSTRLSRRTPRAGAHAGTSSRCSALVLCRPVPLAHCTTSIRRWSRANRRRHASATRHGHLARFTRIASRCDRSWNQCLARGDDPFASATPCACTSATRVGTISSRSSSASVLIDEPAKSRVPDARSRVLREARARSQPLEACSTGRDRRREPRELQALHRIYEGTMLGRALRRPEASSGRPTSRLGRLASVREVGPPGRVPLASDQRLRPRYRARARYMEALCAPRKLYSSRDVAPRLSRSSSAEQGHGITLEDRRAHADRIDLGGASHDSCRRPARTKRSELDNTHLSRRGARAHLRDRRNSAAGDLLSPRRGPRGSRYSR